MVEITIQTGNFHFYLQTWLQTYQYLPGGVVIFKKSDYFSIKK